jgi:hypothetical protein
VRFDVLTQDLGKRFEIAAINPCVGRGVERVA